LVIELLKSIKDFLISLKPDIIIQAPSRINLINPLDAVEGDFWMPSVAINGVDNPLSPFFYIKNIVQESRLIVYTMKNLLFKSTPRKWGYSWKVKENIFSKESNNFEWLH